MLQEVHVVAQGKKLFPGCAVLQDHLKHIVIRPIGDRGEQIHDTIVGGHVEQALSNDTMHVKKRMAHEHAHLFVRSSYDNGRLYAAIEKVEARPVESAHS
jgi:hypothetical protein